MCCLEVELIYTTAVITSITVSVKINARMTISRINSSLVECTVHVTDNCHILPGYLLYRDCHGFVAYITKHVVYRHQIASILLFSAYKNNNNLDKIIKTNLVH